MSRPPSTIHIKRKATDDPVDVLRVHELNGKRQRRATEFVFTRQPTEASTTANNGFAATQPVLQGARRIKPLPRTGGSPLSPGQAATTTATSNKEDQPEPATVPGDNLSQEHTPLSDDSRLAPLQIAQHRRFHISRASTSRGRQSPIIGGKVQKRAPTIFVERRSESQVSRKGTSAIQTEPVTSVTPATIPEAGQSRPQKKPGLAARTASKTQQPGLAPVPQSTTPPRNIRLPSGLVMPWDVTSDQLAQELQAYTLQEIGRAMSESQPTHPELVHNHANIPTRLKKAPSKFKPKQPPMRYRELHPESTPATPQIDVDLDSVDDDDYVIDTYVRMPADLVESDSQRNFGFIVLESQDIEEFYCEDSDHSEDEEYDEEDENAENHYSADYPDEEIESDDEYDRNAYNYRNQNASDDEEFDQDEYSDDDDDDATRYPWRKPRLPSWMREKKGGDEDEDEDEDGKNKSGFVNANSMKADPLADLMGELTTKTPKD